MMRCDISWRLNHRRFWKCWGAKKQLLEITLMLCLNFLLEILLRGRYRYKKHALNCLYWWSLTSPWRAGWIGSIDPPLETHYDESCFTRDILYKNMWWSHMLKSQKTFKRSLKMFTRISGLKPFKKKWIPCMRITYLDGTFVQGNEST